MSSQVTATTIAVAEDPERGHRVRLLLAWLAALALILVIAGYGFQYYSLSADERPFSPRNEALRPSGTIGVKLGMRGVFMFFLIYLYPLRKKWGWLARQGNSRHWLDFHIVLGSAAPVIIAFHASFKFGNIAGMAFYSMLAVTLSGFVGRYLYSQIPRTLNAAELTMKELRDMENAMRQELAAQQLGFGSRMESIYALPNPSEVAEMSMIGALGRMILIDFQRPFQISLIRLKVHGFGSWLGSFFGSLRTNDAKLEHAIK